MKINPEQFARIQSDFDKMQSKENLLNLLNLAKLIVYGEKAFPFTLKQLNYYSHPKNIDLRYKTFKIKKKSGGTRTIHAPVKGLKALQKSLSLILQCVFEPHQAAFGFVRNKSIVDNARIHECSRYVYNIDLKDFFPSVDQARVWKCLQLSPFLLNSRPAKDYNLVKWDDFFTNYPTRKNYQPPLSSFEIQLKGWTSVNLVNDQITFYKTPYRQFAHTVKGEIEANWDFDNTREAYILIPPSNESKFLLVNESSIIKGRLIIANMLASMCCTDLAVNRKNQDGQWVSINQRVLPQGAPSSPVITNIICQRLDYILTGLAKRFGLTYSRYADDITFSSMHNVYQSGSEFSRELGRIIRDQGFNINESKTRLQKDGYRQEVTGLIINEKVNVQQQYIKQLRMWLYYWERYGYEKAYGFFLHQYLSIKIGKTIGKPDMVNVIAGKLAYLTMVKGSQDETLIKLKHRYNVLTGTSNTPKYDEDPLDVAVDLIINNGLDEAIKYYKTINT